MVCFRNLPFFVIYATNISKYKNNDLKQNQISYNGIYKRNNC